MLLLATSLATIPASRVGSEKVKRKKKISEAEPERVGKGRVLTEGKTKNEKPAVNVMHVAIAMSFGLINL